MPDRRPARAPGGSSGAAPDARAGRRRAGARAALPDGPVPVDTGTVEVRRDRHAPGSVTVLVNGVPSSHLDLEDPTWLEFEYMQHMAAVLDAVRPGPLSAVHLGAGACALPRWLAATRPASRQVAVDVDARLLALVRDWFELPRSPGLRLRPGDARAVLTTLTTGSADVVVRDVFAGDVTPDHLTTREFLTEVRRVLRPGGLYLANCADRPPLGLARSEVSTAYSVFDDVALVAEPAQLKGRRYGNLVLAALSSASGTEVPSWTAAGDGRPGGHPGAQPPALLGSVPLERALRSLPVPARLLRGAELRTFAGAAPVREDPAAPAPRDDEPGAPQRTP